MTIKWCIIHPYWEDGPTKPRLPTTAERRDDMPIDYSRLQNILKANGTTLYKLSAEKVIGGKTREVLSSR